MKRWGMLLFLLSVFQISQAYTIHSGHPRIYLTADRIPEMQKRCKESHASYYQDLLSTRWILDRAPGVGYSHMTNMAMPAFLYLVEEDPAYAEKTKALLDAMADAPPTDQYMTPEYIRQAAMCYDWIFADLKEEEKKRYAEAMIEMGDYMLSLWRHSDFNNHFVNEHLSVLYIGVVLADDGIADQEAKKFLEHGVDYLKNHAIPAADEIAGEDGGQAEGFSYNDWGYARPLALTAEMWRVATGEDLFEHSSFFATQSMWHLYCLRPHDRTFVKAEDCPSGFGPGANLKTFMHLLAARLRDPYAQWLGDLHARKYKQQSWKEILWRDAEIQPTPPSGLPLARHFKKLGWVVSRSGWETENDTFSLFQCGDFYAGHQHLDANTFVIHKGGSLAIDSGVNEYSSHRANYYCRTIAHNGILVFDPRETFSRAVWGGDGKEGSNDGGQLRGDIISRVGTFKENGPHDIADITQFYASKHLTYICGDATRAYHPRKMEWFTRQFVHIQPDIFVVFDRVVSDEPSYKKTWVMHSIHSPRKEGEGFVIQHGDGRLDVQTVFPKAAQMEMIGGDGKEYWVNGKNYPPNSKSDPEAGNWRLEVSPLEENTEDAFLHVLQAGLKDSFDPVLVAPLERAGYKGVKLEYQNRQARLLFPTEGEPHMMVRLEQGGNVIIEKKINQDQAGIQPAVN
ncbi:hypothetical protein GF373_16630 [bacterium]|nr:hypothetical protein [bacterium]